ncbi:cysteine proteinase, partial [Thozetella sp. PMI_491]
ADAATDGLRRNPKRKAAPEAFDLPDDLLEKALEPMGIDEREDWQSWVEVESDPAFFNVIIRELGVHDVQVQELFTLDSLVELPKPVYGLVFLYQYVPETIEEETEDSSDVWFANQTTSNACATVALLNIIMNAGNLELGRSLQTFKAETAGLEPPLRGNMLTHNITIRTAHNSFARRLDLLNADLVVDNEFGDAKKAKHGKASSKARYKSKSKGEDEAAFHFIAYVPIGTKIWQLDGLQTHPVLLGAFEGDWTSSVGPFIEARMLQYETEQVSFNLLALCRNPVGSLRRRLAENIQCLDILRDISTTKDEAVTPWLANHESSMRAEKLTTYGLSEPDIQMASSQRSEGLLGRSKGAVLSSVEKTEICQKLIAEQENLLADYTAHQVSMEDDSGVATGRKKDYTKAIHEWTKRLVEHGVLQEL